MANHIRIGTRGSKLALWQANFVKSELEKLGIQVVIEVIKTKGDKIQHLSFDKIEGKGFFTQELEECLMKGQIDMAVHSMKDLPTSMDERLTIAGVSYREDPSDWLIMPAKLKVKDRILNLRAGAIIGTSSNRRKAQLLHLRPDLQVTDLRGNVPTRINKLREGKTDAIMLAAAGLLRLKIDLSAFHVVKLHPREFVPAPAQGILAYQIKRDRDDLRKTIKQIHHKDVSVLSNVERKILKMLDGGCHLPLGAICTKDRMGYYHVSATYAASLGDPLRKVNFSLSTVDGLAERVVENLTKD